MFFVAQGATWPLCISNAVSAELTSFTDWAGRLLSTARCVATRALWSLPGDSGPGSPADWTDLAPVLEPLRVAGQPLCVHGAPQAFRYLGGLFCVNLDSTLHVEYIKELVLTRVAARALELSQMLHCSKNWRRSGQMYALQLGIT